MTLPVLEALLADHDRREAQTAYQAQLLWQLNAQLFALISGGAYTMPDYFTLFPSGGVPASGRSVRRQVLRGLERLLEPPKEAM